MSGDSENLSQLEVNIIVVILFHRLIYHNILITARRKKCGKRSGRPGAAGRPAAKAVG